MVRTLRDEGKRRQVLRWLSWACGKPITMENLDEVLDVDF
jgi:hypothetical protein